jgi:hypothetical protein
MRHWHNWSSGDCCEDGRYDRASDMQLHRSQAWQPLRSAVQRAGHHGERLVWQLRIYYVEREAGKRKRTK